MSTLSPAQPETAQSEQSVLERIQSLESQYLLQNYARYPLVLSRGKGCYAYDAAGKRYLDFIAGIGVNALGHAHPRMVKAIRAQAGLILTARPPG
jgi:acetylornithine/N-succinyldiaminopimelate aminotransferase